MTETTLRFVGDWGAVTGIAVAAALSLLVWMLYFRETRRYAGAIRWVLPTLRALVVMLVVLILSEPILHHEKIIRELGRLIILVDGSQSMELADKDMSWEDKLPAMDAVGLLSVDATIQSATSLCRRLSKISELQTQLAAALDNENREEARKAASPWMTEFATETDQAAREFYSLVTLVHSGSNADDRKVCENAKRVQGEVRRLAERLGEDVRRDKINADAMRNRTQEINERMATLRPDTSQLVSQYAESSAGTNLRTAAEDWGKRSRWARAESMLVSEEHGILASLAEQQNVELLALRDDDAVSIWWQRRGGKKSSGEMPTSFGMLPNGFSTDLAASLTKSLDSENEGVAVLLISDGGHNRRTSSPLETARQLADKQVPVFTVGLGARRTANDMAIVSVKHPNSIFAEDYVRGTLFFNDRMPNGQSYDVRLQLNTQLVWQTTIQSQNSGARTLDFEFPIKPLMEKMAAQVGDKNVDQRSFPMEFDVTIRAQDASVGVSEKHVGNNARKMFIQAVTQKRKLLILDGRPRWEMRYVRNLFERQSQWEVVAMLDGLGKIEEESLSNKKPSTTRTALGNRSWRDSGEHRFPRTEEELFQFDLIVIGDLPRHLLSDDELIWIEKFAALRGGGVVFVDGRRGHLRNYAGASLEKMLPVEFTAAHQQPPAIGPVRLSADGENVNALRLVGGVEENRQLWRQLPSPRWMAPAHALPGTTVHAVAGSVNDSQVVNAEANAVANDATPLLVTRRYGAGQVLYVGSDELWRWRYKVGDLYHQKLWTQISNWIGQPPFAVAGSRVSIGTDQGVYEPNSTATFHVQLRDTNGVPVIDSGVDLVAMLFDGSQLVGEIPLKDDGNDNGIFRGRSGRLDAGRYTVRIKQREGYGKQRVFDAATEIVVKQTDNEELTRLALNRELLQDMARYSGGRYFDEYELPKVVEVLESLDQKKVITSETPLGYSWWWFVPIVGLLTVEWILRKRLGYV